MKTFWKVFGIFFEAACFAIGTAAIALMLGMVSCWIYLAYFA